MARCACAAAAVAAFVCGLPAQVIEFESNGLRFQTQSRNGVTVMFAHLPGQLRDYDILQVAVSNGAGSTFTVRPEDMTYQRANTPALRATAARAVVTRLMETARRDDVIKLVHTYESTLFGITRFRSTNGYEMRRQEFLAEMGSNKLNAAAAASAIAFVETRLAPGESTDGAVFFQTAGKPLGAGHLTIRAAGYAFEFDSDPAGTTKSLRQRPPAP